MAAGWRSLKRALVRGFWRVVNPLSRPLAGRVPWWVQLQTVGCSTGRLRRTPLASGPVEPDGMWLLSVHGRHSSWVRNLEADHNVCLKHRGRWRTATAAVEELDRIPLSRFNLYARTGLTLGRVDPLLIRVTYR